MPSALRFGANSLGGAINFVTPSGRDAGPFAISADVGSFGYRRIQASSGGASGPFDYFVTGSYQVQDGFRDHSNGNLMRGSANFGYKITPDIETRFYFNGNTIEQRIPGAVTKNTALTEPQTAQRQNVVNDWQRNINSNRIANKTAVRLGENTTVEFGAFNVDRHLMHPIFQWLDYTYDDYGGFGRVVDDRKIYGFRNRLVAGINIHNGQIDNQQFGNGIMATKGPLLSSSLDKSKNTSAYAENSFYFLPNVAAVAGTQFLRATRQRIDRYLTNGDQSGETNFDIWSPKFGLLWDVDPTAQVYANISRSAEVPSFGESVAPIPFVAPNLPNIPFTDIKAQRATTYEIGTRGRRPDYNWDIALYRSEIQNELQCLYSVVRQLQRHQCRPHGASGRRNRRGGCGGEVHIRAGRQPGQTMAPGGLHLQRLLLRQRSEIRRQPAARHAAAIHACGNPLQASVRHFHRTECRVGAAPTMSTAPTR